MTTDSRLGLYKHNTSGKIYTVLLVANEKADREDWSAPCFVYSDQNGNIWTRPIEQFLKRCTKFNLG